MEFTTTGLKVDSQTDIFNNLSDDLKVRLSPYLSGTELKTDESSVIGRLLRAFSKPMAENNEILPQILKQLDLNQVEKDGLDNLAYLAHRMKRKDMALAEGSLVVYGDSGVTIPNGSLVANSVTGDIYSTQSQVTFDINNVCGITFSVSSIQDSYTINYSVTGLISQNPTILIKRVGETTVADMAQRIVNSINSQSTVISAKLNNDNTVTILLNNQQYHADFGLPTGLVLTQSFKLVDIKSQNYSSVTADQNTITVKKTSVDGWRGLYNPFPILPSYGIETDEQFKERIKFGTGTRFSSWDSVYARLYEVKGVTFVNVKFNSSKNTVGSVTNNGLAISVLGGDEDEIALAISQAVSAGIATVGTIGKVVKDINGGEHSIHFSRPEVVPLTMKMQITQYRNFPTNGKQLIKQAIVDYFNSLTVGESVQYSRLYSPINTVTGFSVSNMVIGKQGDDMVQDNIYMNYNQIASLSADNILIGGS